MVVLFEHLLLLQYERFRRLVAVHVAALVVEGTPTRLEVRALLG